MEETVQGKLKRIKNFFQSSTDFYRIQQTQLQISKSKKNGQYTDFQDKYDLNNYTVDADHKEYFYLVPNKKSLSVIKFSAQNDEQRERWVQGLVLQSQRRQSLVILRPEFQPQINFGQNVSLNQISNLLSKEDSELSKQQRRALECLNSFKLQVASLKKKEPKMEMLYITADQFIKEQEQTIGQTREIAMKLFELTEQLAAKQMQDNPKKFMLSQINNTSDDRDMFFDVQNSQLILDQMEENKELGHLTARRTVKMIEINEDLEDDKFFDAVGEFHQFHMSQRKQNELSEDYEEPLERDVLPWLKDPNVKMSIWAVIKDSIGKDISKMSVPVYFNDPTSLLQKCAMSMEYNNLLDLAAQTNDSLDRLALISVHAATFFTSAEFMTTKPFNPILGETYEFKNNNFEYLAEQVSHHPPITACYCRGKNYTYFTNQKTNTGFNGKYLSFTQQYRSYVDIDSYGERYEIQQPVLSAHNLLIGNLYIDIGESLTVINLNKPNEKCIVKFERRGWFSDESYKLEGNVFIQQGKKQINKINIKGNWNSRIFLQKNDVKDQQVVWQKNPQPGQSDHMYGMSHFSLQMNYFPKRLQSIVAPTDTRRRPDQRALENGDMKTAAAQKERLENRQRSFRKYHEANGTHHQPRYFEPWMNPNDKQIYWVYNKLYFEQDRKQQNWSNLPDLFGETVPENMIQYF